MKTNKHHTTLNLIKDIIRNSEVALSHKELQTELGEDFNRVTIYRSLDKLMEIGEIHRVVNMDGVTKFAMCASDCAHKSLHHHRHVHFSCIRCQEVTCLESVVPDFSLPKGYAAEAVNFMVSGVCPNCG